MTFWCAPVAKLVDALDSKSSGETRVGSSPTRGTIPYLFCLNLFSLGPYLFEKEATERERDKSFSLCIN